MARSLHALTSMPDLIAILDQHCADLRESIAELDRAIVECQESKRESVDLLAEAEGALAAMRNAVDTMAGMKCPVCGDTGRQRHAGENFNPREAIFTCGACGHVYVGELPSDSEDDHDEPNDE